MHNDSVRYYLKDSPLNITKYADGSKELDKPLPIKFNLNWQGDSQANVKDYTLKISEKSDMSNAFEFTTFDDIYSVYNFKIGTEYFWTSTINYNDDSEPKTSEVSSFTTSDIAPRMLNVSGVKNFRDLGGRNTIDGVQTKQGLIFRSYQFDDKSGKILINSNGINTVKNVLKLKSEIDLRASSERGITTNKSVVDGVNYFSKGLNYNDDYLDSYNKAKIKEIFNILSDENNYPVVIHCAAGADRTGVVSYLINGLLGVEKDDLLRDYFITNFSNLGSMRDFSKIDSKYVKTLDEYIGDNLQNKIYNYLKVEVGVPQSELDTVISIMK